MVDTIHFSYDINPFECDFILSPPWHFKPLKNNREKEKPSKIPIKRDYERYDHFFWYKDPYSDIYIKYQHQNGPNNPSRFEIQFPSISRFIHGNNVYYFTIADLMDFNNKMVALFKRAKIPVDFKIDKLLVKSLDLSFNLLLADPQEPENIFTAVGKQFCLNSSHPLILKDHGLYGRSAFRNYPDKSTIHNNGPFIYDKYTAAKYAGIFPDTGIFRFENKLGDQQTVTRTFGKNFKFIDLFTSKEQIMKSCSNSLKHLQITAGNSLISRHKAMLLVSQQKPLRNQKHPLGHLDNLLMAYELWEEDRNIKKDFLVSAKEVNWFRTRILNKKLKLLHAVLDDDDDHEYPLYDMIMAEIESYFNGTSIFIK